MFRPMTMLMAAFVMVAGMGIAQAGPRARAAHHAAHHTARAAHRVDRWVDNHTPNVVIDWRLRYPNARIVVVDGYSVPSIAGVWSITMRDASGHTETVQMSGSTPDAAVSSAKQAFRATGHSGHGTITVTALAWVNY